MKENRKRERNEDTKEVIPLHFIEFSFAAGSKQQALIVWHWSAAAGVKREASGADLQHGMAGWDDGNRVVPASGYEVPASRYHVVPASGCPATLS
jgi:hypothetical protein